MPHHAAEHDLTEHQETGGADTAAGHLRVLAAAEA